MAKVVEQRLRKCGKCQGKTLHMRNASKMGLFGFLVHLVLTVFTGGLWLIVLLLLVVLNKPIGGWKCQECSSGSRAAESVRSKAGDKKALKGGDKGQSVEQIEVRLDMSKSPRHVMVKRGFKKKKYPVMAEEMITPEDCHIPLGISKGLYKLYLERTKLGDDLGSISEALADYSDAAADQLDTMTADRDDEKKELECAKAELAKLRLDVKQMDGEPDDEAVESMGELIDEVKWLKEGLKETNDELVSFKKDKRSFLVDYINARIDGL